MRTSITTLVLISITSIIACRISDYENTESHQPQDLGITDLDLGRPDLGQEHVCGPNEREGFCAFDCNPQIAELRVTTPAYCTIQKRPSSLKMEMTAARTMYGGGDPIQRGCLCVLRLGSDSGRGLNLSTTQISMGFSYDFDHKYLYDASQKKYYWTIDYLSIFTRENINEDKQRVLFHFQSGLTTTGDLTIAARPTLPDGQSEKFLLILFYPDHRSDLECTEFANQIYCPKNVSMTINNLSITDKTTTIVLGQANKKP